MLPVIESRDDISIEQFANKTQNQIATSLQITSTKMTTEDIKTWRNSKNMMMQCSNPLLSLACNIVSINYRYHTSLTIT